MHLMHSTCTIVCITNAYHAFPTIFWQILHRLRVIKYRWYRVIIVSNPKISCNIVWIQKKRYRWGVVIYPMSDILCHISSVKYPPVCSVRYMFTSCLQIQWPSWLPTPPQCPASGWSLYQSSKIFSPIDIFPVTPSSCWPTRALIQVFKKLHLTTLSTMIMMR